MIDRLLSGPGRADPPCRHFGSCGGCSLQHFEPAFYQHLKLATLRTALERVGIDPGAVEPLRLVPPARRRARLGFMLPRDPQCAPRIGFRQRFRHDLVDLAECLVMEPPLLAAVGPLRRCLSGLMPPGGTAEATLTATDSGVDLLIEAAEAPSMRALETCAELAAQSDLARVVWRGQQNETLVVERRPVRVVLSGAAVPFPPGAFLQASREAEAILVEEVLTGVGARRPVLDLFLVPASAPSPSPWLDAESFAPSRASRARRLPLPRPPRAGVRSAWNVLTSRATRSHRHTSPAMPQRSRPAARRRCFSGRGARRFGARHGCRGLLQPSTFARDLCGPRRRRVSSRAFDAARPVRLDAASGDGCPVSAIAGLYPISPKPAYTAQDYRRGMCDPAISGSSTCRADHKPQSVLLRQLNNAAFGARPTTHRQAK